METEQTSEAILNKKEQSTWNTVTPFSKHLAMTLFVIMPFIGGWVGYMFAPEKIVEVEKIVETKKEVETVQPLSYSKEQISGACSQDVNNLEPLYTSIETKFLNQFPSYETLYRNWGVDKNKPKARLHNNALFSCELEDGTYLASFIYENNDYQHNNTDEPKFRFRIIHFEEEGNILTISPENESPSIGGTFKINSVKDGVLEFSSKVTEPCYSATHSYSYDLSINAYREYSKGGNISDCIVPSPGAL